MHNSNTHFAHFSRPKFYMTGSELLAIAQRSFGYASLRLKTLARSSINLASTVQHKVRVNLKVLAV